MASSGRVSRSWRISTPSGVPPGSRVRTYGMCCAPSHCPSKSICVVLPAPSSPSNEIKRPLLTLGFLYLYGIHHNPSQSTAWEAYPPASIGGLLCHIFRDTLSVFHQHTQR